MPRKYRSFSINVDVDVDDVLDELGNEELIEEMRARRLVGSEEFGSLGEAVLRDIRDALIRNRPNDALAIVDRYCTRYGDLKPEWRKVADGTHPLFSTTSRISDA